MAQPTALRYTGLPPSEAFPFAALTAAAVTVANGAALLTGWAVEETTGVAVARAVIGDGSNRIIANTVVPLTLAANESRVDYPPGAGVLIRRGLTVQVTAGTVAGSLWAVMLTPDQLRSLLDWSAVVDLS